MPDLGAACEISELEPHEGSGRLPCCHVSRPGELAEAFLFSLL